jgi:hypothetical protein
VGRIVEILRDPQAEQVLSVKVRGVERIGVGAEAGAEDAGQVLPVTDGGDGIERGLERLEAGRVDRRGVHEAGVVVADLSEVGARGGVGFRGLLDQLGNAAVGEVEQLNERAVGAAVGGDLRLLEPGAVGVLEEVVARLHRAVHASDVEGG